MLVGKYAPLNSPLVVAQWYTEKLRLESTLRAAQKAKEDFDTSPEVAMEKCFQWVLSHTAKVVGTNPENTDIAIDTVRSAFRNRTGTTAYLRTVQAQWVDMILPFCILDVEGFTAAFRQKHPALDIAKEGGKLEKAVKNAAKALEAHLANAYDTLVWNKEAVPESGVVILAGQFVNDWKTLSVKYSMPVSLYGVLITDNEVDAEWKEAYDLLGFKTLPKAASLARPIIRRRTVSVE